jgi:ATP-binding cassette, subfamily B, bacterial
MLNLAKIWYFPAVFTLARLLKRLSRFNLKKMNHQLPKSLSSFIWHFLKQYKLIAAIFMLLAILAGFWGPFNAMLIKRIINILPQVKVDAFSVLGWPVALIVLNFIAFDNITWRGINYINYKFQPLIKNQITSELLKAVMGNSHRCGVWSVFLNN